MSATAERGMAHILVVFDGLPEPPLPEAWSWLGAWPPRATA